MSWTVNDSGEGAVVREFVRARGRWKDTGDDGPLVCGGEPARFADDRAGNEGVYNAARAADFLTLVRPRRTPEVAVKVADLIADGCAGGSGSDIPFIVCSAVRNAASRPSLIVGR